MSDFAVDAMGPHLAMWRDVDLAAPPEATRLWLARAAAIPEGPRAVDLHARYVERYDDPQHGDPARTRRYLDALGRVRSLADAGEAPSLPRLAAVQGVVLGLPDAAPLRETDAFARAGAHRYPMVADLEALVRSRAAAWSDPRVNPLVGASAAYLDILFVHPFLDGNARAAMLCYEWLLRRARRPLPHVEDLLRLQHTPGDVEGFWRVVRLGAASSVGAMSRRYPHDDGP